MTTDRGAAREAALKEHIMCLPANLLRHYLCELVDGASEITRETMIVTLHAQTAMPAIEADQINAAQYMRFFSRAAPTVPKSDATCGAGFPIGSGPCPVCSADDGQECGGVDDAKALNTSRDTIRAHYRILEDGPGRFVLVDERSDDPAPVYVTIDAATAAMEALVAAELGA